MHPHCPAEWADRTDPPGPMELRILEQAQRELRRDQPARRRLDELDEVVTAEEVAGLIGVSVATVISWCQDESVGLPHRHVPGGKWLFLKKSVKHWLEGGRGRPCQRKAIEEPRRRPRWLVGCHRKGS